MITRINNLLNCWNPQHVTVVEISSVAQQDDIHLLATNVYAKTPRGWRIVLHHVSIAPGPVPTEARSQVLH